MLPEYLCTIDSIVFYSSLSLSTTNRIIKAVYSFMLEVFEKIFSMIMFKFQKKL